MSGVIANDFGTSLSDYSNSLNTGNWLGLAATAIDAGTDIYNNERNIKLTKQTNAQNEALMRESWLRDDSAVQRRVADLKAAGLSPTLAAGSAAANSGSVTLKAPESKLKGGYGAQTLAALQAVKSLKNQDLQNAYLMKQIVNYGKPDWMVALHEIFGTDKFEQLMHGLGDKLFNLIFPEGTGSPNGSKEDVTTTQEELPSLNPPSRSVAVKTAAAQGNHQTLTKEFQNAATYAMDKMLKDRTLSSGKLFILSKQLAKKYDYDEDFVMDYLFDLWDRMHGDEGDYLNYVEM